MFFRKILIPFLCRRGLHLSRTLLLTDYELCASDDAWDYRDLVKGKMLHYKQVDSFWACQCTICKGYCKIRDEDSQMEASPAPQKSEPKQIRKVVRR